MFTPAPPKSHCSGRAGSEPWRQNAHEPCMVPSGHTHPCSASSQDLGDSVSLMTSKEKSHGLHLETHAQPPGARPCLAPSSTAQEPSRIAHTPSQLPIHSQTPASGSYFPCILSYSPEKSLPGSFGPTFNQIQTAFSGIKGVCLGSFHVAVRYPRTTLASLGNSPRSLFHGSDSRQRSPRLLAPPASPLEITAQHWIGLRPSLQLGEVAQGGLAEQGLGIQHDASSDQSCLGESSSPPQGPRRPPATPAPLPADAGVRHPDLSAGHTSMGQLVTPKAVTDRQAEDWGGVGGNGQQPRCPNSSLPLSPPPSLQSFQVHPNMGPQCGPH